MRGVDGTPTFRVLGVLEVIDAAGNALRLRSVQQQRLLAALLLHANRRVSVDALAEFVWGEHLPDVVTGAVQTHISRARQTFSDIALVTVAGGYELEIRPGELDADRFEQWVEEGVAARSEEPVKALECFDRALALWRGPAYADFLDWDIARIEASRLEELRIRAVEERFDALLALGRHDDAVSGLRRLVDEEPLRERPTTLLMTALYRSGRQADALRAADGFRRRIAEELGLEPSPLLRRLEEEVLDHRVDDRQPPRGTPVAPHVPALPRPVTPLIGREQLVEQVVELCRRNRVVTLTGPGGVGKTRLALEAARRLAPDFDARATLCELAPLAARSEVAPAVATTLAIEPKAGTTVASRIVEGLRPQATLVVLDCCEHVVDAAARLVEQLVEGTDRVVVLATSRERLAVRGEQVCPVEPLVAADAIALFVERARSMDPDFDLTDDDRAEAAEICQRLDGLPLAIELASARTAALSVGEIARALHDRFTLLSGRRGLADRHASLRETIGWSYELLGDDERRLLDELSVFAGGLTIEAAAAVAGRDLAPTATLISSLVDRSLVRRRTRDGKSRFGLLDTVREFATERLRERGEEDRARAVHAQYYVDFAERQNAALHIPPAAGAVIFNLHVELANFRAAHQFLVEQQHVDGALRLDVALFWYAALNLQPEVLSWAEATVSITPEGHPLRPVALASCARAAWQRGDTELWQVTVEQGLARARDDRDGRRALLGERALGAIHRGRLDEGLAFATEALRLDADAGDRLGALSSRAQQLTIRGYAGDDVVGEAEAWVAETEAGNHPIEIAMAYYTAGELLVASDPTRARQHFDRAIELARATGSRFVTGIAGVSAASTDVRLGNLDAAVAHYRELIGALRRGVMRPVQSTMLRSVADLLRQLGAAGPAATLLGFVFAGRTAAVYGEDVAWMERISDALRAQLGEAAYRKAVETGGRLDDDAALEVAATALDRLA